MVDHPNVVAFLGISYDFDRPHMPCLVSPYFHNGNVTDFLKKRPNVDKFALVSRSYR